MIKTTKLTHLILLLLGIGLLIGSLATLYQPANLKVSLILSLLVIGVFLIWPTFRKQTQRLSSKQVQGLIYLSLLVILIGQLLILSFLPATIFHDPFRVLSQAEILSQGDYSWQHSTYFWRYPNNVALTAILAKWLTVTHWLHLSTNTALHLLSILCLDSFIWMSLQFTHRYKQQPSTTIALSLFFTFSPWAYTYFLQVFYSDLPTLWALMFGLIILQKWPNLSKGRRIVSGVSLVIVVALSQLVKPNFIVFGIATGILLYLMWRTKSPKNKPLWQPLLLILVGFALTVPAKPLIQKAVAFTPHPRYELPATHWIYMSYNPDGNGTYDGQDVLKMITLKDKTSRQEYLQHALPQRLQALGPLGILQRWYTKTAILLNVNGLPEAYTSGFIEAPRLYQRQQSWWQQYTLLTIRLSFAVLYLVSLLNVGRLWHRRHDPMVPALCLAMITAVGYLAFHGLLWETENRYGQALLPLLLVLNALMPAWSTQVQTNTSKKRLWTGIGLLGASLLSLFWLSPLQPQNQIVAAQKSQLSAQYAAKWQEINAHSVVTQAVNLNQAVNYFSVSTLPNSKVTIRLVDRDRPVSYELKPRGDIFTYRGHLPMGRYRIVLNNIEPKTQPIKTVQTLNYQLTPHPLKIDGHPWPYTSLLYIGLAEAH